MFFVCLLQIFGTINLFTQFYNDMKWSISLSMFPFVCNMLLSHVFAKLNSCTCTHTRTNGRTWNKNITFLCFSCWCPNNRMWCDFVVDWFSCLHCRWSILDKSRFMVVTLLCECKHSPNGLIELPTIFPQIQKNFFLPKSTFLTHYSFSVQMPLRWKNKKPCHTFVFK